MTRATAEQQGAAHGSGARLPARPPRGRHRLRCRTSCPVPRPPDPQSRHARFRRDAADPAAPVTAEQGAPPAAGHPGGLVSAGVPLGATGDSVRRRVPPRATTRFAADLLPAELPAAGQCATRTADPPARGRRVAFVALGLAGCTRRTAGEGVSAGPLFLLASSTGENAARGAPERCEQDGCPPTTSSPRHPGPGQNTAQARPISARAGSRHGHQKAFRRPRWARPVQAGGMATRGTVQRALPPRATTRFDADLLPADPPKPPPERGRSGWTETAMSDFRQKCRTG